MIQNYEKLRIAIQYWQVGRGFHNALRAMNFASKKHIGFRKDNVTPEFQHQVSQANYARTLIKDFKYPEETMTTIWLHDVCEDYGVSNQEIVNLFGRRVGHSVELMTNQISGIKKPTASYYHEMQFDPIASLNKGIDRIHNHQRMQGVFTREKQSAYISETEEYILPMLKEARKNFPEQESAYQNIRQVLLTQIDLIRVISGFPNNN